MTTPPPPSGNEPWGAFAPGFEFLQGLMKNAGPGLPQGGQWVVPTLDPAELERRIQELRTVQYWLEQNVRMIAATVQALEVQRLTLTTLRGLNVTAADLAESLKMPIPPTPDAHAAPSAGAGPQTAAGVDPMPWWVGVTQQFANLAAQAVQATAASPGPAPDVAAHEPAASLAAPPPKAKRRTRPSTPDAGT